MDRVFLRYIRKDFKETDSNIFKIEDIETNCRFYFIQNSLDKNTLDFTNKMGSFTTIGNSASSISLTISKKLVTCNKSFESLGMIQKLEASRIKYM